MAELVNRCWCPFSGKAAAAGIVFENHLNIALVWKSDTAGLSMIVSNLLDNAVEYTDRGGRIWVTARKTDVGIEIIFENTGNQLTGKQTSEVFGCFWRGDSARSNTGVHCGLGLALVKRIIEALGGSVCAESQNGLFNIRIYLPLVKNGL
jgi:signal transduction histidine kinase